MKKITIISDSLGYERPWNNPPIYYHEVYFYELIRLLGMDISKIQIHTRELFTRRVAHYKFRSEELSIQQYAIGALSISELYNFIIENQINNIDLLILQVGIVDSTPRILSKKQLYYIRRLPIISRLIHKVLIKYRREILIFKHSLLRKITRYSSIDEYRNKLHAIKQIMKRKNIKVKIITICPISKKFNFQTPHWDKSVKKYNGIIRDIFIENEIIDLYAVIYSNPEMYIVDDGHHLNQNGHKKLAHLLQSHIESLE